MSGIRRFVVGTVSYCVSHGKYDDHLELNSRSAPCAAVVSTQVMIDSEIDCFRCGANCIGPVIGVSSETTEWCGADRDSEGAAAASSTAGVEGPGVVSLRTGLDVSDLSR